MKKSLLTTAGLVFCLAAGSAFAQSTGSTSGNGTATPGTASGATSSNKSPVGSNEDTGSTPTQSPAGKVTGSGTSSTGSPVGPNEASPPPPAPLTNTP